MYQSAANGVIPTHATAATVAESNAQRAPRTQPQRPYLSSELSECNCTRGVANVSKGSNV